MELVTDHYLPVGGEPTYVTKCGPVPTDVLILIIPGNPGCASYYDEFIHTIYQASGCRVPAWAVSHAGHVNVPKHHAADAPKLDFYHLRGQIQHKVEFIREHVPSGVRLILLGHSIGAYIILHMLEELGERVVKCGLLFLTIERMAESPKGRVMTPLMKYCRWLAPLLMYPASWLPGWLHKWVLEWYFRSRPVHEGSIKGTQKLISSPSIRNITNMANEEFQTVVRADYHIIERHLGKLWFYYGSCDHWCPVDYYQDMRKRYPDADISLCEHGFEHAFCLESSRDMGNIVWTYLVNNVQELKHS